MNYKETYNAWLQDENIDEATKAELRSIEGNESEIEDRFYKELEFGTGGLRGILGAGTNRMNIYTVAKATQGLADYINKFMDELKEHHSKEHDCSKCDSCEMEKIPAVAIGCDSRNMSDKFCEITASVLNANGIKTFVFESLRPTPELSFTVRHLGCIAGVNVTASHNAAEYNGYKVFWADGAQVTPPHDEGILKCVNAVANLSNPNLMPKEEAIEKGLYVSIGKDIDEKYMDVISKVLKEPALTRQMAKDVTIAYTPLHGAGIKIVPEILKRFGFTNLHIVKEQEEPDGNFPTVDFPNPEMPSAFKLADELGQKVLADIIIATDPDSDRLGAHVKDGQGKYHALTGNMLGNFMCEYVLSRLKAQNKIPEDGFVIRSIVSSKLFDRIAASYNVQVRPVLTGFKYIGAEILKSEMKHDGTYLFGFEESYGFLPGTHCRDKDACATALLLCEMVAFYKYNDETLWDGILDMYEKYGYEDEKTISITKKGVDGMLAIKQAMTDYRENPPKNFGSFEIKEVIDYNEPEKTNMPKSNVLYYKLDDAWVCVRPSGTEPKIKYYIGVSANDKAQASAKIEELEKNFIG